MRSQTSSRTRRQLFVSNGRLCAGACEKIPRTFAHSVGLFNKIVHSSLVCWCIRVSVCLCVNCVLSLERHQSAIDFDPGGVCGGPLCAPPFTSARVKSRFEFVEIGRGMCCSNYQGEVPAVTEITGWYQLVPRTIYESTVYMYENIGYVQVPEFSPVQYV